MRNYVSCFFCSRCTRHWVEEGVWAQMCAQMRLLAHVNLCSVADEANHDFITMSPWLDSDHTRWDYCWFFFGSLLIAEWHFLGVDQSEARGGGAKSKDPFCGPESWLGGIGLRMSCAQRTLMCWRRCKHSVVQPSLVPYLCSAQPERRARWR